MNDRGVVATFVTIGIVAAVIVSRPFHHGNRQHPRSFEPPAPALLEKDTHLYAQGTINLGSDVDEQLAAGRVLFIIVRSVKPNMPVAIKRIPSPDFPVTFSITNADNLVDTTFFEGDLVLLVRLDADGKAGKKERDDIEEEVAVSASSDRNVQVTLTR